MEMKKIFLPLLFLALPVVLKATDWHIIGPDTVQVNDVFPHASGLVLLTTDGIYLQEDETWNHYPMAGLGALGGAPLDQTSILLILGRGSNSDGIYRFNTKTHKYELIEFTDFPNFLVHNSVQNRWYVGYRHGLLVSGNGTDWASVATFNNRNCVAMAFYDTNWVVSTSDAGHRVFYSSNSGEDWSIAKEAPLISDLAVSYSGTFYGVYPGDTRFSGVWKSDDYGENWENEFNARNIETIQFTDQHLFVGWHDFDTYLGVGMWDSDADTLIMINDGLSSRNIRKLTTNIILSYRNLIACTDSGAYITTDMPVAVETESVVPNRFQLSNYPNPFNSRTTITIDMPVRTLLKLEIFDATGRKVDQLYHGYLNAGYHSIPWNAKGYPTGIYFYRATSATSEQTGKCVLIK